MESILFRYRRKSWTSTSYNILWRLPRAAKKLFLSQPPLSMQMKRLEKELGCVLFLRGAREVQLTEAGKLLYTRAKSMLELRRITEEELAVCSEQTSGTIRLGVISSVGCSLLPQWLKWFHAQYPQIRFSLYESDTYQILEKLHQDRVELALVRSHSESSPTDRIAHCSGASFVLFRGRHHFPARTGRTSADYLSPLGTHLKPDIPHIGTTCFLFLRE